MLCRLKPEPESLKSPVCNGREDPTHHAANEAVCREMSREDKPHETSHRDDPSLPVPREHGPHDNLGFPSHPLISAVIEELK